MEPWKWPTEWQWEQTGRSDRVGKAQNRQAGPPKYNAAAVLHTTENSLVKSSAAAVARWQNGQKGTVGGGQKRYSGYHLLVDHLQIVGQCNPDLTRAFHAGRSAANGRGGHGNNDIGVAMVARESRMPYPDGAQNDLFHQLLDNVAEVGAELWRRYRIPPERISTRDYRMGKVGWLGHHDVAVPLGRKSDPGEHFPWDDLMERIAQAIKGREAAGHPPSEDLVRLTPDEIRWLRKFYAANQVQAVTPSSLAYILQTFRAERTALDVPQNIGPADYGKHKAALIRGLQDKVAHLRKSK